MSPLNQAFRSRLMRGWLFLGGGVETSGATHHSLLIHHRDRVDLKRSTAWLDQTKNGTPRGVPLNRDAVAVLEAERGKHPVCSVLRIAANPSRGS